jgi:hypothetical protein
MLKKIISGGQTGADQGGLEGARLLGIATGGVAPRGYKTEKGQEADLLKSYGLVENPSAAYAPRTWVNVHMGHGTVWFGRTDTPGYNCTRKAAKAQSKPWLENPLPEALAEFVHDHKIEVLNVAGNRESKNPGIYVVARDTIVHTFGDENGPNS